MLAVVALAGCGTATARTSAPQTRQRSHGPQRPSLPVRAPRYSVLQFGCPAHPRTDQQIEACEARERLGLNAQFDTAVTALWPMLDRTGKWDFAAAQKSWNQFASEECAVAAREFLGGSEMPIEGGQCLVNLTRKRVRDVTGMLALYCQGKVRAGPYRRCPRR